VNKVTDTMRTSLDIEDDLRRRLGTLAAARKQSTDDMIGDAIRQYVEREETRDGFTREAIENWANFQRDGLHLSGQETRDWLDSWGGEEASRPPECHE